MPIPWCEALVIRPLAAGDVAAVARLERQAFSPWPAALVAEELADPQRLGVVAILDETLIGWCCGRFCGDEGELLKLSVDGRYRRRGIGTRLLREWETRLQQQGVRGLFLEVRSKNRAALELYGRLGYGVVGRRRRYYQEPEDDAVVMSKEFRQGEKR
ncbi:MAG: ribosomal protein S18-alanine N-acetyltransferase [Desulfofustis sp.]|nr:ribosomal protein S18-alanine N-acetyltransferase [Desulfofustis sp.]